MLAVFASDFDPADPLSALEVGECDEPAVPDRWTTVTVRAASLNHHDLWSLRGVGLRREQLPMILGCDASGTDEDGNEVVVHGVITEQYRREDGNLDWRHSLLSERHPGTFAGRVAVPPENLLRKPEQLSFAEAACLPTAWLTAYRMLFTRGRVAPGATILVQGATGGVATALTALAAATGVRVWVTGRSEEKRTQALALGAEKAFEPGARLPERVDAVMETTGGASWAHSVRALKPEGTIVVSGATTGDASPAELTHIFFRQLSVLGSTMGTRAELEQLLRLCVDQQLRPTIHEELPLVEARRGFEAMLEGNVFGKIVFTRE